MCTWLNRKFDQAIFTYRKSLIWTIDMADWGHVVWLQCCFAFTAIGQSRDLPPEEAAPLLLRAARLFGALQPVMEETDEIFPVRIPGRVRP